MGIELAKAFITLAVDQSQLPDDMDQARQEVVRQLQSIGTVAAGVLASVSAVTTGIIATSLGAAGALEEAQVEFEVMLGSAEKAKELLQELTDFAAKTPFEMPGIRQAARVLLAFGVTTEDLMDDMKALGDVSAGTGKAFSELAVIFGQVKAKGKLQGEELLQLAEAGVPIRSVLAKNLGVAEAAIGDMASKGKIGFGEVRKAFRTMTGDGGQFFNMMDRKSGTFFGLMSTLKDSMRAVFTTIGESLLPAAKAFVSVMIKIGDTIKAVVSATGNLIPNMIAATAAVTGLTTAVIAAKKAMVALGITVRGLLIGSGIGIAFVAIGAAIGIVITAVQKLINWLRSLAPVQDALKIATQNFSQVWKNLKEVFSIVGNTIMKVINAISSEFGVQFSSMGDFVGAMIKTFSNFVLTLSRWGLELVKFFASIVDWMFKIINAVRRFFGLDDLKTDLPKIAKEAERIANAASSGSGAGSESLVQSGRFSFAQIGTAIQDAFLKGSAQDEIRNNTRRTAIAAETIQQAYQGMAQEHWDNYGRDEAFIPRQWLVQ